MEMSITAKAAWPLLWTVADDRGVFDWKPKGIKAAILPADNVDMVAILEEWKGLGVIRLVEIDGKPCGLVKNFCKFQSPKFPTYRYELTEDMVKFVKWKPRPSGKGVPPPDDDTGSDTEDEQDQPRPSTTDLPQPSGKASVVLPHGEERRGEERKEKTNVFSSRVPRQKISEQTFKSEVEYLDAVNPDQGIVDFPTRQTRAPSICLADSEDDDGLRALPD